MARWADGRSLLVAALVCPALVRVHAQECTALGCTMHKREGWVCQCNFHCVAHGDCCADFAAACPNSTDPLATAGANQANHSAGEHTAEASARKERVAATPHEHAADSAAKKEHLAEHERDTLKKEPREHAHTQVATPSDREPAKKVRMCCPRQSL